MLVEVTVAVSRPSAEGPFVAASDDGKREGDTRTDKAVRPGGERPVGRRVETGCGQGDSVSRQSTRQ